MRHESSRRILVVDDDPAIRQMIASLMRNASHNDTNTARLARMPIPHPLGKDEPAPPPVEYVVEMASQGQSAYNMARAAILEGDPFLMAFIDLRMPPGWDGIETMIRLWELDPAIQIALCTAYSDYSWEDLVQRTGRRQNLLILKKPFDFAEAAQMAFALSEKGLVTRSMNSRLATLERLVEERTVSLEQANRQLSSEIEEKECARREVSDLLENTVKAIASVLVSMIEMGNPLAFSHAKRIQANTVMMVKALELDDLWCYELAAILSQLGCATIPEGTLRRYFSGADLSFEERSMILAYPAASAELISKIPNLEAAAAMMGFRDKLGDASAFDVSVTGPIEAGAWILRTAIDFDVLLSRHSKAKTIEILRRASSDYPAILLDILDKGVPDEPPRIGDISTIPILALEKDMVINHDIIAHDGVIVARRDQHMTDPLLKRIRNFIQAGQITAEIVEILTPRTPTQDIELP